jgi:hypothetical protein
MFEIKEVEKIQATGNGLKVASKALELAGYAWIIVGGIIILT